MQTIPLNEGKSITLDGSGNGTVLLGPTNVFQTWVPSMAACNVSSNNSEPTFILYNGKSSSPLNQLASTYVGSNDVAGLAGVTIYPGGYVTGLWKGGDPGATATLILTGDNQIPG